MTMKSYPLCQSQLGVFVYCQNEPLSTQYNLAALYELPPSTDMERMRRALEQIVEARPVLHTRLHLDDNGTPMQCADMNMKIAVPMVWATDAEANRIVADYVKPFNVVGDEPLCRFALIDTPTRKLLLHDFHHLIMDGTSLLNFRQELADAYNGKPLAQGCDQMYGFAQEEMAHSGSDAYRQAAEYYAAKFGGVEFTDLAGNKQTSLGNTIVVNAKLPKDKLNAFGKSHKVEVHTLVQAAFAQVLSRLSRQHQVAYASVRHGRFDKKLAGAYGMLEKTVPVVAELRKDMTAADFVMAVGEEWATTMKMADYSFAHFCTANGLTPRTCFAYQGRDMVKPIVIEGQQVAMRQLPTKLTSIDLTLLLYSVGDSMEIRAEASDSLYSADYVKHFVGAVKTAVGQLAAHWHEPLDTISIVSDKERQSLIALGTGERLDYDHADTLVDLLARQARMTPDAEAVVWKDHRCTYRQLDELTTRLAILLRRDYGVRPETTVGVMIDRSEWMAIYPLAVMKAGGAYMPLDFHFPEDRLGYMVADAKVGLVLTEGDLMKEAMPNFHGDIIRKEEVEARLADIHYRQEDGDVALLQHDKAQPENAYVVLYTSGSTGRPKGCVLEHHNIVNFCHWYIHDFHLTAADRGAAYANFGFDAHMIDLYPLLSVGGTAHILASDIRMDLDAMHDYIEAQGLTIAFFTTQIGVQLASLFKYTTMRLISTGGEKLIPLAKPDFDMYNVYGPTECTLFSTFYQLRLDNEDAPIGRPLANYRLYVMDDTMHPVPRGMAGELCVAGEGVGRGYLNNPEMTAAKFVEIDGARAYRTGDLVKWNADGDLAFLGRMDGQVKLRGLRIEIGEIESRLSQYEGIATSAVAVKEVNGVQMLCAYYTADGEVDHESLGKYLGESLADFMVPEIYVRMDKLPLTPNGKVNRKELPVPQMEMEEIVPPQTDTEQKVFDIVAELLGNSQFGVASNLRHMGVTSIVAMRLGGNLSRRLGVQIAIKDLLAEPTVRGIAARVEAAAGDDAQPMKYDKREYYPLTENVRGLYLDWELNSDATQYNIPVLYRFADKDASRLARAAEAAVDAHPMLKAHFAVVDGEVMMQRRDDAKISVAVTTVAEEPGKDFFQAKVHPFNLLADDLLRIEVVECPTAVYLFLDAHHTVFDGMSIDVLFDDIFAAYDGKRLEGESVTGFDYALYEQELLKGKAYAEAEAYFDRLLGGAEASMMPDSATPDGVRMGMVSMKIPAKEIEEACRKADVTVSDYIQAAFALTLSRLTRQDNPLYLTLSGGRNACPALMQSVGMFVKTLPVTIGVDGKTPTADYLKAMQRLLAEDYSRDFFPYTHIVERMNIRASIMCVFQGGVLDDNADSGTTRMLLDLDMSRLPIVMTIFPEGGDYRMSIEYDGRRYGKADMEVMLRSVANVVQTLHRCATLHDVSLVDDSQAEELLALSVGEHLDVDPNATFPSLFMSQAATTPGNIAVVDGSGTYTYAQLNNLSGAFASHLVELGVGKGDSPFVCVMLGYQKEFVVAAIGIEKAGCAYIPLDYSYPIERLLYMLEDSESKVLVTSHAVFDEKNADGALSGFSGTTLFIDDYLAHCDDTKANDVNLATPDSLAYMIYTSGSTGKPKGVMIPQRAKVRFVLFAAHEWGLDSTCRICCHASFSFDTSVESLYPALTVGGTVYPVPQEARKDFGLLSEFIRKNGIMGGTFTTQLGQMLLQMYPDLPLKYIVVAGEKMAVAPKCNCRLINGYGPTEFTVLSTFFDVEPGRDYRNIPIGRPLYDQYGLVVDTEDHLLPQGVAGELCVSGAQMARGYWRREELTAERFCDIVVGGRTMKVYHTGDLARYNADGQIEYLGRIDSQVKLRGFRIELGEIETLIGGFEGVKMTSVVVREIGGVEHLCAYFTADKDIDIDALQEYLAGKLAEYMVPTAYMRLDEMPLTPNGKVNKRALPEPQLKEARQDSFVAPEGELETAIAEAFATVLKRDRVGANDDFFKSGGTSLSAIKVVASLMTKGYSVTYKDLFKYKTPRGLAIFIDVTRNAAAAPVASETIVVGKAERLPQSAYAEVLEANTLDALRSGDRLPIGNVLLTGATGYLGIHLLYELLQNEGGAIYCVLRGKKSLTPERRLRTLFFYYFNGIDEEVFDKRIRVVEGDLTDGHSLDGLPDDIDTVFNCAANVKHFSAGDDIEKVNVESVRLIVDWCLEHDAHLVHVSTVSIAGQSVDGRPSASTLLGERMFDFGQGLDNQYVRSKYEAEKIVLTAIRDRGLVAKIMRVGNLAPRNSDGEFQINYKSNAFMGRIAALATLECVSYGALDEPCEFSPIDAVCQAIRLLAQTPRTMVVFHPYNNHSIPLGDVLEILHTVGVDIKPMEDDEFNKVVQAKLKDEKVVAKLQPLFAYDEGDTQHVVRWLGFDNSYTTQVLHRLGFRWPYTSWDYAERFVKAIHGFNYI